MISWLRLPSRRVRSPRRGRRPGLRTLLVAGSVLALMAGAGDARAQIQTEPGAGSPGALPPELREEQVQDWTVLCGSPSEGAPEQCEMRQQVSDAEGNTQVLVVVGSPPNLPAPGMVILMPLGIYLPAGVSLRVDGGAEMALQVQFCTQGACQAEVLLEDEIMGRMKAGSRATLTYAGRNAQGQVGRVQADVSLLGFTAALGRVQG